MSKIILLLIVVFISLSSTSIAFAQNNNATNTKIRCENNGINTAIGCIPSEPKPLVERILGIAIGAGGGVALLLMIFGAIQMIASAGNPEGVKKGQEQFTSAIIGLVFLIFSVLLLKIIGVDILGLGAFFN